MPLTPVRIGEAFGPGTAVPVVPLRISDPDHRHLRPALAGPRHPRGPGGRRRRHGSTYPWHRSIHPLLDSASTTGASPTGSPSPRSPGSGGSGSGRPASSPYNRITNVDIAQGPLMRFFSFSALRVQTAGYSAQARAEIVLNGIEDAGDLQERDHGLCAEGRAGRGRGGSRKRRRRQQTRLWRNSGRSGGCSKTGWRGRGTISPEREGCVGVIAGLSRLSRVGREGDYTVQRPISQARP